MNDRKTNNIYRDINEIIKKYKTKIPEFYSNLDNSIKMTQQILQESCNCTIFFNDVTANDVEFIYLENSYSGKANFNGTLCTCGEFTSFFFTFEFFNTDTTLHVSTSSSLEQMSTCTETQATISGVAQAFYQTGTVTSQTFTPNFEVQAIQQSNSSWDVSLLLCSSSCIPCTQSCATFYNATPINFQSRVSITQCS